MNLKVTRLGYAMWRFFEGFRHGAQSQREIHASKLKPSLSPSLPRSESPWFVAHELLERLDFAECLLIYGDQLEEYLATGTIDENEWKSLEPELSREQGHQEFLERKRKIQDAVREKLLSDFVRDHVPIQYDFQRGLVKNRIKILLWEGKKEQLQAYLTDVLELGPEKADKKLKREQRKGGYLLYAWLAVVGAIKVGIVLGVFSVSKTKFETIVIALIVLTYQMIEGYSGDWFVQTLLNTNEFRMASKRIRRLLKEEAPEEVRKNRGLRKR